ncbi:hypothetical protein [Alcaligenes faecalis]|uniref:hypothetical protein n=1 Tax=Alcaligenes faecalis TaxID=511 RepID=UPI00208DF02A|nr:hypothetical protein [Alcaligenes faecalis]USP49153.1 hypothetical protein J5J84_06560 [Alcaligenes faecalis]
MNAVEIISLISSIVSLVLAIGAIWLSVVFFRMSNEAAKATTEAAKGIDASVKRLENLFDKLYSDTFSMMKDTVSDMRKHIWNGGDAVEPDSKDKILEEADKKAEEKVEQVKKAMDQKLSDILARQRVSEGNVTEIKSEMERLLESAIQSSRQIDTEAREETLRSHIMLELRRGRRKGKIMTADDLVSSLSDNIPPHRVVSELSRMRDEKIISFEGDRIGPDTRIRFLTIAERSGIEDNP